MESHSYTKHKRTDKSPTITTVEVGNVTVKVQHDGKVRMFDPRTRMFIKQVPMFSPLAAEARKLSGRFE